MDLLKAIEDVLKSAHQPLHVGVIAEKVISGGLWKSSGKTPEATISARLYSDIKKKGEASAFVKVSPQAFALRDSSMEATNSGSTPTPAKEAPKPPSVNAYHYLFSLVYEATNSEEETGLQQNYHLPNIARRLLESFLAFRQPAKSGELRQQLDLIDFDVAKKSRILRFLHTHSHAGQISDPVHDPSILIETKQVLSDLLCLIQKDDDRHFDQMKALVIK